MVNVQAALTFSKMHGAGNDFVILDLNKTPEPTPSLCSALADRHRGVGCDLILGVAPPRTADAIASYRIWTADGSPSGQCGNGARCVAAWIRRAGLCTEARFLLDSPAGTHVIEALEGDMFRVAMGKPQFHPKQVPLAGFDHEQDFYEVETGKGPNISFGAVSIGNPHAVIEVPRVKTAPVGEVGPLLQESGHFPESVNVGFVEILGNNRIRLRVFEFGAGETKACGTGACAAAVTLMRRGRIDREVVVELPGGELSISWDVRSGEITKTGPAAFVFDGSFYLTRSLLHHLENSKWNTASGLANSGTRS